MILENISELVVIAGRGTRLDHQRAQQVGTRKRRDTAAEVDGDSLGAVKGLAGSRELGCAQRWDRGQIGTCAHALGSDHIGLEAVADELVAVPVDVEVFGIELPALGLQQRRHCACGTGRASGINDGICVGGGRTCRSAGLVFVQHDHERPDERPSTGPMIGDIGNRRPQLPGAAEVGQDDGVVGT